MDGAIYTVTFNSNGGSAVNSQSVAYNGTVTKPTDPTRTGYTFVRWCSDGGLTTAFSFATPVTADTTLYAQWQINSYTLTYSAGANGSISGTTPQTVQYGGSGTAVTAVPDSGYLLREVERQLDGQPAHRRQRQRQPGRDGQLRVDCHADHGHDPRRRQESGDICQRQRLLGRAGRRDVGRSAGGRRWRQRRFCKTEHQHHLPGWRWRGRGDLPDGIHGHARRHRGGHGGKRR